MYALSQIHGVDIMAFATCSFITFDMNVHGIYVPINVEKANLSSLTWIGMTYVKT